MDNLLSLSFHKDPVTLDPQKSGDQLSSALIFLLFKGLTRLEADHSISCDLAESYQISKDSKTYTFHLGCHSWSDGSPITAHDFVYSWKRALQPAFPLRATNCFQPIRNAEKAKHGIVSLEEVGAHAKDEKTLVVELENPCPYFLELTSFCPLFPVPSFADEKNIAAICSGPFLLDHRMVGQEITLKKNPLCKNLSPVQIDRIHIRILPDEKIAFSLFENGELDWMGDPISPLPLNYLPALLEAKKVKPIAGTISCWFNTLTPPFDNLYVRNAFSCAIERGKILKKLLLPNILSSPWPVMRILKKRLDAHSEKQNILTEELLEMALKEMKSKHLRITLAYEAREEHARLAMLLKTRWEQVFPIAILLKPLSFKELFGMLPHPEFDLAIIGALAQYTDVINFLERLEFRDSPRNFSGWEDPNYQALLSRYRNTEDKMKRLELADQAEAILMEQTPIAPIYSYHYSFVQKPYVKNLVISPVGIVQFDRVYLMKKEIPERNRIDEVAAEGTGSRLFL